VLQWHYYRDNNEVVEFLFCIKISRVSFCGNLERRDLLEASANELFEAVALGKVRINVNQRFALKDAADAHKGLEARATSGSTVLTI